MLPSSQEHLGLRFARRLSQLALLVLLWPSMAAAEPEVRAGELIGRTVHAPEGEWLGDIAAVLIDSRPRGVHFLVVETPLGERFAYPASALRRDAGWLLLDDGARAHAKGSDARYERASRLLGRAAEDPLGNAVGALRDVAIDLQTGRTAYVLVEFAAEDNALLPLAPHLVRLRPGANPVVTGKAHRRS